MIGYHVDIYWVCYISSVVVSSNSAFLSLVILRMPSERKVRKCIRKSGHIVTVLGDVLAILGDHMSNTDGAQRVYDQVFVGAVDVEDLGLAVHRPTLLRTAGAVMVEETVQARAVDGDASAVQDTERKRITDVSRAVAVVGILQHRVGLVGAVLGVGIGLVVSADISEVGLVAEGNSRSLCLDKPGHNILST